MALGYIASFTERLAMSVIVSQGVIPLAEALKGETDENVRAAAAWSLGQIGRHTPEHAEYVAKANVFSVLVQIHEDPKAPEDLQTKVCTCSNCCFFGSSSPPAFRQSEH